MTACRLHIEFFGTTDCRKHILTSRSSRVGAPYGVLPVRVGLELQGEGTKAPWMRRGAALTFDAECVVCYLGRRIDHRSLAANGVPARSHSLIAVEGVSSHHVRDVHIRPGPGSDVDPALAS